MAFRKSSSSGGKGLNSPVGGGDKSGAIAGANKTPGASFRKSSKGSISSPVEYGAKGMPSGIKVVHNRPAVLD